MAAYTSKFDKQAGWIRIAVLFYLSALAVKAATAGEPDYSPQSNRFFPLAKGNTWSYNCSTEGVFQFRKKITITSTSREGDRIIYRADTQVGSDPKPVINYLSLDSHAQVMTSQTTVADGLEPVISAAPKVGDHIGNLTVASVSQSTLKKFSNTETVRLENFNADDPKLPDTKRMEWVSKSYGKGIGLLEEADGLGGSCVLTSFHIGVTHQPGFHHGRQ